MRSTFAELLAGAVFVLDVNAVPSAADWQWHRIAWQGTRIGSVVCAPTADRLIYVSIGDLSVPDDQRGVHASDDAGQTWRFLAGSSNPLTLFLTVDEAMPGAVYCGSADVMDVPALRPRRSRDGGDTWELIDAPLWRIAPSPWARGFLLGVGGTLAWATWRSLDDAVTWESLWGTEATTMGTDIIFDWADSAIVFACMIDSSSGTGLGRSTDGGMTWSLVFNGGPVTGFDQDPLDNAHVVAVFATEGGGSAGFAESFDHGDSWETRPIDPGIGAILFDRSIPSVLYLVEQNGGHGAYRSDDGGLTWDPMESGLLSSTWLYEIYRLRERPGELLAAASDGLWLWTNRVGAEGPQLGVVEALRIERVTPCPFRDVMAARLWSPSEGTLTAEIYSLDSRLVRRLMVGGVGAGRHELVWDGRTSEGKLASPGAYGLRVETDKGSVAAMVVRVR